MTTDFPDAVTYGRLYARFVQGGTDPQHFLFAAKTARRQEVITGLAALDLCAGSSAIARLLKEQGAWPVVVVDQEEKMVPYDIQHGKVPGIHFIHNPVRPALVSLRHHGSLFDLVFCRQGVNYWLDSDSVVRLAHVMRPEAVFVFNTFANRPPEHPDPPLVKQYELGGDHFVEVSWYELGEVKHVQICNRAEPHFTSFRDLSQAELRDLFAKRFQLTIEERGKTLFCVARRTSYDLT